MNTERAQWKAGAVARDEPPIDLDAIEATITRALRVNAGHLDVGVLRELEEELRGHVDLLLPEARTAAGCIWHGSIEWHRQTARLDGIERQAMQGVGGSPLAAHVQVQQLARDCQWLLNQRRERAAS
ncbi:DUF6415 family natural product biosynthesis protein [Streptomyces lydicus]|uniref:DUF6415 family natural product biosynthesis protein n=1 Tax=Streptomyces lydicus TaxID=47763 RepID=UPI001011ABD0|nr:DUF6415 family natural product biosynthesis protein [Streptomyces lydicus]MCZ1006121.1 DUF6415 family natural product biosynthesis protein [Streptomyces lydicus]